MLPSRGPEASKCLNPCLSTHRMTHIHGSSWLVEVFYSLLWGAKWGPGCLRPSRGLCLGLGAAVSTEAECSRVLRGEEGLGAEGPGSFLHSILWMQRGQPEGQGQCWPVQVATGIPPPPICPTIPELLHSSVTQH